MRLPFRLRRTMTPADLAGLAGGGLAAHAWARGCERAGGDLGAWLNEGLDGREPAAGLLEGLIAELGLDPVAERARIAAEIGRTE